jgi:hypothetical protein
MHERIQQRLHPKSPSLNLFEFQPFFNLQPTLAQRGSAEFGEISRIFVPRNQLQSRRGGPVVFAVYGPLYSIPCGVIGADFVK